MSFKVICVDNSGLENELEVGKLYEAELEDTSRPSSSDWFFKILNVRAVQDSCFSHYRFEKCSAAFLHGYNLAITNLTSVPADLALATTGSSRNGYVAAQNYLLKKSVSIKKSTLSKHESLVLRYSKTENPDIIAPALIGECIGRLAEMSDRNLREGLIELYLRWMLDNASPEYCIMFGRVIIESKYPMDKTNSWDEYVNKFKDMVVGEPVPKKEETKAIRDVIKLSEKSSLVATDHGWLGQSQLEGALYSELKLRIALDKPLHTDELISAYIGWFINHNSGIDFVMKVIEEFKDVVTNDFWNRENIIKARGRAIEAGYSEKWHSLLP